VQYTEELYRSRALRFYDGNKELWLNLIGVREGMKVLEVGCGSGIFCHRIKTFCRTHGHRIDLDTGHIEYAKKKSKELGIDCTFINADATALPFPDNSFDLCYSYTVIDFCDPNLFISEQKRVLKSGGTLTVLNIHGGGINSQMWKPEDADEEKALFDKLWSEAGKNKLSDIKKYPLSLRDYPINLEKAGLKEIKMDVLAVAPYNPDNSNIFETLISLINRKYDQRIEKYQSGEKLWDFSAGITFAAGGKK